MREFQIRIKNDREECRVETEQKQLKSSLARAVAGILLLLLAATGTTYAWFTLTGQASTNVTPTGGTISKGDTVLLISASADGPFENCASHSRYFSDELDAQNFYQKRNKCLMYSYAYGILFL